MRSRTTEQFRRRFVALPDSVRSQAMRAYQVWRDNPAHPGLHFRRVHSDEPIYSVRIGLHWREPKQTSWGLIGQLMAAARLCE